MEKSFCPAIETGKAILSKTGFAIASNEGVPIERLGDDASIGVLFKKNQADPFRFIGIIWFRDEHQGARGKNWVFQVFEREYIKNAEDLISDLLYSGVTITLRLLQKQ